MRVCHVCTRTFYRVYTMQRNNVIVVGETRERAEGEGRRCNTPTATARVLTIGFYESRAQPRDRPSAEPDELRRKLYGKRLISIEDAPHATVHGKNAR